ncbi:MAG TPA: IS4 family transposase [Bacteroidales bacterium]
MDSFYREVTGAEFNIRQVTKGAFSQARSGLNPSAFIEMNDNVCGTFYTQAPYLRWKKHRLLAVDGTRLLLPNHKTVKEEFGEYGFGPNADSMRSMAIASMLYDVLNLVTLDAQIEPYSSSERELLYQHLTKIEKGDLLLLDRGYPSLAIMFLLSAMGVEYCVRMKEDWWLKVKEFSESGKREQMVRFDLPKKDQELFEQYPHMANKPIQCRLVCVTLENGEKEILCTSLTDHKKYTYDDIEELYHYRWNEEEAYKLLKARAELECFSGKTALAVKQDFHAKIFALSYCAILAFPIEEKVRKESQESKNKHPQKINRTSALSMLRNVSVSVFLKQQIEKGLQAFDSIVYQTREIVRPGRKHERKKRPKKLHHMNYKAL